MSASWMLDVGRLRARIVTGEVAALEGVDQVFDRMREVGAGRDGLNILL